MTSEDYPMTFPYGAVDGTYYGPYGSIGPYHRGDDYFMPDGTPIVVSGVLIGYSGHSGEASGPHVHVGKWVDGRDRNPNGQAWDIDDPVVTDVGYDDVNGHYVGLRDAHGVRWVYLHMESITVKAGDVLSKLPKFKKEAIMAKEPEDYKVNKGDIENIKGWLGLTVNDGDYGFEGYTWKEFVTTILTGQEWKEKLKADQGRQAMAELVQATEAFKKAKELV